MRVRGAAPHVAQAMQVEPVSLYLHLHNALFAQKVCQMSFNCPAHSVVLLCYMVFKPLYIYIILICGASYLSCAYPS